MSGFSLLGLFCLTCSVVEIVLVFTFVKAKVIWGVVPGTDAALHHERSSKADNTKHTTEYGRINNSKYLKKSALHIFDDERNRLNTLESSLETLCSRDTQHIRQTFQLLLSQSGSNLFVV